VSTTATTVSGTWRPVAVTDALIAPPLGDLPATALRDVRVGLVRDLTTIVAELPRGEKLVLDDYHLRIAAFDPERCGRADAFSPSPRTTRRAIGVVAVDRCVRGRSTVPATAVSEILAAAVDDVAAAAEHPGHDTPRLPWWAEWYCRLGPGGRAVVEAEAVTWSSQLWTAVAWERLDHVPVVGGRDDWWACPGARQLTLKGRAEVRVPGAGRQALLVVAGGAPSPGWRIELGFPALVAALVRGERGVPVRVVGTWPSCGQFRVLDVDARALEDSARAVVSATGTWVGAVIERH
jgi:hypothetical protein